VTGGRLPQRAGLPGLNGGGADAEVPPPMNCTYCSVRHWCNAQHLTTCTATIHLNHSSTIHFWNKSISVVNISNIQYNTDLSA